MARKERKPKHYVDSKDDALKLAQSVAETQEDKFKQKIERHAQHLEASKAASTTSKKSRSRDKLKEVKAALASEAAKAKREKAKARKQAKGGNRDGSSSKTASLARSDTTQVDTTTQPRKRVSFAG